VRRQLLYRLATSDRFEAMVRRSSNLERIALRAAHRYVAGTSLAEALEVVRRLHRDGLGVSLDLFGEGLADPQAAERVLERYVEATHALGGLEADAYLEVVPSHLGIDRSVSFFTRHAERIIEALPTGSRLQISAEESWRTPAILEAALELAGRGAPITVTLQANLRRSVQDAERLAAAGVPVRLVKGAYVERADVALPWGEETDIAFLRLAHMLHGFGADLALATHDPVIREAVLLAVPEAKIEMLLGVREEDAKILARRGHPVRIYVPFGEAWFRYWMRRVAESMGA
jgi:proline dehydrogenase